MNIPKYPPSNRLAEQYTVLERVVLLNSKASWGQLAMVTGRTEEECREAFRTGTRKRLNSGLTLEQLNEAFI